jgi:hypothetical protein
LVDSFSALWQVGDQLAHRDVAVHHRGPTGSCNKSSSSVSVLVHCAEGIVRADPKKSYWFELTGHGTRACPCPVALKRQLPQ